MRFLAASRLLLLAVVVGIVVAYLLVQLRRRRDVVRFTNVALLESVAPRRPGWRRHLTTALWCVGLTLVVVAFARPTWPFRVPRERATVMLAIDVSLSMAAKDVEPNRLQVAQRTAREFVETFPKRFRLGLVAFSGTATVAAPPSRDHARVLGAIDSLQLGQQTAIGEAIFASLDAIEASARDRREQRAGGPAPRRPAGRIPARIVVLSDGATTAGRPNETAARAARRREVPVSTIAFGTDRGVVTVGDRVIPVPADRDALREIADITGGSFSTAATRSELARIYADLGSSIGFRTERQEVAGWFLGFGLAFAFGAAALSLLWSSRLP